MKLVRKLTVALVVGILAVMACNAYLRVRREMELLEADMLSDQQTMGRALRIAAEWVWRAQGVERARGLIENADERERGVDIRWRWLDGPDVRPVPQLTADARDRLAAGQVISLVAPDEHDDRRRYTYAPVLVAGAPAAAVELSESLASEQAFVRTSVMQSVLGSAAIVVVCGVIAMAIGVWFVGRPLRALAEKARRVGEGDLAGRLEFRQRDEIGALAAEIDAMCDRLSEAQRRAAADTEARIAMLEQLRHADRLKTVGQLASGVAHELGTPLNIVLGRSRMIGAGDLSPADVVHNSQIVVDETQRMIRIIRQLLDFSRRRGTELAAGSVVDVARRTVEMLTPLADRSGVRLRLDAVDGLPAVQMDESQLQQALANLIVNAIQSIRDGGVVRMSAVTRDAAPPTERARNRYVCVTVEDDGEGIAPDYLPRIFEPFFTTKDVGEGTGLGLAVAYGIVQEHGGWIAVETRLGVGTTFSVYLPPSAAVAGMASEACT